ncbi:MAG: pyridoxamine 5'-phosphate oxidase family protein [Actinomycetota bacterium]|nr:pyridoxamine 5'-phosphate oxidase family protein [Actinomycetota bacterium]
MRRKDREVKKISEILTIIDRCRVCRIAITDKDKPYIVPLNFGYFYGDKKLTLFFHSAPSGRKIELIKENPDISFEMDFEKGLIKGDIACKYGYLYQSIIGEGRISFIEDKEEKLFAFNRIMQHQTGSNENFIFDVNIVDKTLVYKLNVTHISAKSNYC